MTSEINRANFQPVDSTRYAGEVEDPGEKKKATLKDQLKFETLLEFADARKPRLEEEESPLAAMKGRSSIGEAETADKAALAEVLDDDEIDGEEAESGSGANAAPGGVFGLVGEMAARFGKALEPSRAAAAEADIARIKLVEAIGEAAEALAVKKSAGPGDASEVRIELKREILPDTSVRIARDPGGERMLVEFTTRDASANQFLLAGNEALRQQLAERFGGEVSVRVVYSGREREGEADQRGRSPDWDVPVDEA